MDLERALRSLQAKDALAKAAPANAGAPAAKASPKAAGARPEAASPRAPLIEIFHSIQGEGRFVGVPMAFVRTATCPLRCLYCDTPHSYVAAPRFPVRLGGREQHEPNPVASDRAAWLVRQVAASHGGGRTSPVSLTGGEPLVFPDFVREFGRAVRQQGHRLHLETAAIDAEALARCIEQVDHLSADYKLPETLGAPASPDLALAPGGTYGQQHLRCCEVALRRGATVDVKIVLTDRVVDPSFERALEDLAPVRARILLVLQPVTPFGAVTRSLPRLDLERFTATAGRLGFDVRVLPQVHKALQVP